MEHTNLDELEARMLKQYDLLMAEQQRVKMFLNENNFDCTSAPFVIVKQYRDALKRHLEVLRVNINELYQYLD